MSEHRIHLPLVRALGGMPLVAAALVACSDSPTAARATADSVTRGTQPPIDAGAVVDDALRRIVPTLDSAGAEPLRASLAALRARVQDRSDGVTVRRAAAAAEAALNAYPRAARGATGDQDADLDAIELAIRSCDSP